MENKEKKILCILTIYNEIKYLPLKLQYCIDNDLDLYVIDNMSNDGSWEWLQENNIPSHRFDTNDAFHLTRLQKEMVKTVHKIKPHWVIYNGCDLFPISDDTMYNEIMKFDKKGYNILEMDLCGVYNTGEKVDKFDPTNTYFYFGGVRKHRKIHKYDKNFQYFADHVILPNPKISKINGIMINYGNAKPAEEREETLKRRQKAWSEGEPRGHGTHYLQNKRLNWVRDKKDLTDIRETKYKKYIEKLQNTTNKVIYKNV